MLGGGALLGPRACSFLGGARGQFKNWHKKPRVVQGGMKTLKGGDVKKKFYMVQKTRGYRLEMGGGEP